MEDQTAEASSEARLAAALELSQAEQGAMASTLHSLSEQLSLHHAHLQAIPSLELEVLHHAERAEALEAQLYSLERRNESLAVLAHARSRAFSRMHASARLRLLSSSLSSLSFQAAFFRWREAAMLHSLPPPPPPSVDSYLPSLSQRKAARLAQLEYDSRLLRRLMRTQCEQSRHTTAASLVRSFWGNRQQWLLANAWSSWLRLPSSFFLHRRLQR